MSREFFGAAVGVLMGTAYAAPAFGDTVEIEIENDSSGVVCYVYVSPCEDDEWGPDILEEDVLGPGESGSIHVDSGCYDLRAEDCDGDVVFQEFDADVYNDATVLISADEIYVNAVAAGHDETPEDYEALEDYTSYEDYELFQGYDTDDGCDPEHDDC